MQFPRKLIDCRFQCKNALRRTITTVRTCRHGIGVNHIISESICFGCGVQRDRFVSGQTNRGRPMLAKCSGIRQGINVNCLENSIFIGSEPYMDLHLVARGGCDLGLITGVDQLRRFSGLPRNQCRIHLGHNRLLCTEATANSWL